MTTLNMPFSLPGFVVQAVKVVGQGIEIQAEPSKHFGLCPCCGFSSTSVHSHYQRRLNDLPLNAQMVWLVLTVRRFRCRNPACSQRIFTERLPEIAASYARRTLRSKAALNHIGLTAGGEAGSRLARSLHLPASADTILRILRQNTWEVSGTLKVLGIDDWAFAKGRRYGTVLVDLERHRPIALLPDRTAETLSNWLKNYPDLEIITRDRFSEYALAVKATCPPVQQVADRWHLLKNLRETLERILRRLHGQLRTLPTSTELLAMSTMPRPRRLRPPSANEQASSEDQQLHRYQLYNTIHDLLKHGLSQHRIADLLHLHRATVRHFAEAATFPERVPQRQRRSILDRHLAYLHERWQAGNTNARQLYRELQAQGYSGSYQQVARWAHVQRQGAASPTDQIPPLPVREAFALPPPHRLVWLFLRLPEQLSERDTILLSHLFQNPACHQVYDLAQAFCSMLRSRSPDPLDDWLATCTASKFSDLREFALGLLRDLDAVRNALIYPWSNGQVEGQINRLKLIKRQMYGRAKLDLLCVRVLASSLTFAPN